MKKDEIRKKYKSLRKDLSEDDRRDLSIKIANQSLTLPIWDYTNYHIYMSIQEQKEVSTEFLLHILLGKDKNILIPKTDFENQRMYSILLTDTLLIKKNKFHIPEPQGGIEIFNSEVEVVFLPLLAYDKEGHRIGYGMGFYDRFLEECRENVIKIGLSFYPPEETLISEPHDVKLNYCITPDKIYEF